MAIGDLFAQRQGLLSDYSTQNAAQEFGRMLGQQRFARRRQDATRQFQQQFPRFTGSWAHRLGSGVKSGVMGDQMGQMVSSFGRGMQDIDVAAAQAQSQFEMDQAARKQALERALQALREQAAAQGIKGF
jgi:hypothetical protein